MPSQSRIRSRGRADLLVKCNWFSRWRTLGRLVSRRGYRCCSSISSLDLASWPFIVTRMGVFNTLCDCAVGPVLEPAQALTACLGLGEGSGDAGSAHASVFRARSLAPIASEMLALRTTISKSELGKISLLYT